MPATLPTHSAAVEVSAFRVYVMRTEPNTGRLCLVAAGGDGTTLLVKFDEPETALAVAVALRLEAEAAIVAATARREW